MKPGIDHFAMGEAMARIDRRLELMAPRFDAVDEWLHVRGMEIYLQQQGYVNDADKHDRSVRKLVLALRNDPTCAERKYAEYAEIVYIAALNGLYPQVKVTEVGFPEVGDAWWSWTARRDNYIEPLVGPAYAMKWLAECGLTGRLETRPRDAWTALQAAHDRLPAPARACLASGVMMPDDYHYQPFHRERGYVARF